MEAVIRGKPPNRGPGWVDRGSTRGEAFRLVCLAVGTSGAMYPAAGFVDTVRPIGRQTWLVNAQRADTTSAFEHFVEAPSGTVLPALFAR